MLTRSEILAAVNCGDISIEPFNLTQLNPNSYDLRLSPWVLRYAAGEILDASVELSVIEETITDEGIVLQPNELYLMATQEVTASKKYIPCIEGRSSVGRLGVAVHATAGFGDVGFNGTWTLEVSVIRPVRLFANMRICQIFFEECNVNDDLDLYNGKYNGQIKPKSSKIYREVNEWLCNKNKS